MRAGEYCHPRQQLHSTVYSRPLLPHDRRDLRIADGRRDHTSYTGEEDLFRLIHEDSTNRIGRLGVGVRADLYM